MNTVAINLPRPPSVNEMFRNVPKVGRVKTAAYKNWISTASWLLHAQRPNPIQGKYRLLVLVGPTRADIDNLAKAVNDLLQSQGVVENDRLCEGIALERSEDVPANAVHCIVQEVGLGSWITLGDAALKALFNLNKVA